MSIRTTPWKAEVSRNSRGGAKVVISNESTKWSIVIRYMADDYDSALVSGTWDEQGLFLYNRSKPGVIAPDFYLEDGKLKCFVSLSAAGTVRIDDVQKEIENLVYCQTVYVAVVEALHQYFPGILK